MLSDSKAASGPEVIRPGVSPTQRVSDPVGQPLFWMTINGEGRFGKVRNSHHIPGASQDISSGSIALKVAY